MDAEYRMQNAGCVMVIDMQSVKARGGGREKNHHFIRKIPLVDAHRPIDQIVN